MTFSVVIPAYNGEKYIESAIISALNQTRLPDEIIIHDDNSCDSTSNICSKYNDRILYLKNNHGPSGFANGWNKAVNCAKSDFITILHQDDILYSSFLEEAETLLKQYSGIRHLFAFCDYIDSHDNIEVSASKISENINFDADSIIFNGLEYVKAYQKSYSGIPHIHRCPGVVTHKSIFIDGCWFNEAAGLIADDDFFYRLGQFTDVIGILKPLAAFRIHNLSVTGRLKNIELVENLAKDYIYQMRQWEDSSFLDNNAKSYFEFWALKYTGRLMFYASNTKDIVLRNNALRLYNELKKLKRSRFFFLNRSKLLLAKLLMSFS